MRHTILLLLTLTLFSCAKESCTESQQITFHCINITTEAITPLSRATLSDAGMTDLWVFEGTTLLIHQQSTDTDFGTPTITLTYGQHSLTFITSKSEGQTFSNGTWSTTHVVDDFAATTNVNISGTSSNTQQVSLSRRSSRVKFLTTDNVPASVHKCHIKVSNHLSLDASLVGGSAYTHDATVSVTSKQGSTLNVFVNTLTSSATTEEDTDVMIEFLDANDTPLYHYNRTVKLLPNRLVTLKGAYFSGLSNAITISTTEWDNVTQDLFPTE